MTNQGAEFEGAKNRKNDSTTKQKGVLWKECLEKNPVNSRKLHDLETWQKELIYAI